MIPTAEQLDALFRAGTMKRLGIGSRRACYAIPGADLCVKCYRSDEEIAEGKCPGCLPVIPLAPSVIREIRKCRFDERRNTCCQEYRYWQALRDTLPADLVAIFPETLVSVCLPSRGWSLVESRIANADGSPAKRFHEVWLHASVKDRCRLVNAFAALVDGFCHYAVRFFDPPNLLVQRCADGAFRLRIVDFEPASRTLLPLDRLSPFFIRRKVRHRFAHYGKVFGIGEMYDDALKGKGRSA